MNIAKGLAISAIAAITLSLLPVSGSNRSGEAASPGTDGTKRLIDDVNVFVGTDGFGNVYPGPQLPYGAIQISPDCDDKDYDCAAGYKYSKPYVQGFSLTHLSGTGIPDLGDFLFTFN